MRMATEIDVPEEFRIAYIHRRKADFIECLKALESCDFDFLEKIGHQVRGNAQSFGFDELSPVGTNLEKAAKAKDLSMARKIVENFGEILSTINIA
jgi:HPt (histidine-containing phosphotransfer) domain-containing protein